MRLTREQAQNLLWSSYDGDLVIEATRQMGSGRWASRHLLVVKDADGRFWAAPFERGLTEYQDIEPFEDEPEVEFREVEKIPVTTYEYREKR